MAKKPIDYKLRILGLARYYARDVVRDQITAKGEKLSRYAARDISAMADRLFLAEPERFVTQARKTLAAEIERQLLKTVHTLHQSVNTSLVPQMPSTEIA